MYCIKVKINDAESRVIILIFYKIISKNIAKLLYLIHLYRINQRLL